MTFKSKLPGFLSASTDPAGETLVARTVMDADEPEGGAGSPVAAVLGRYPVVKRLQILGGALLLTMLVIAVVTLGLSTVFVRARLGA